MKYTYLFLLTAIVVLGSLGCDEVDDAEGSGEGEQCEEGEIVLSETDCFADGSCFELDDGRWCTFGELSCPSGYEPLEEDESCSQNTDLCFEYFDGYFCKLTRAYTQDQCAAAGGQAISDPGDGSLIENGCSDSVKTLAYIVEEQWIEGGLCCEYPEVDDCYHRQDCK